MNTRYRARVATLASAVSLASCTLARAGHRLDDTWTLTLNGQALQVNANGGFWVPNNVRRSRGRSG